MIDELQRVKDFHSSQPPASETARNAARSALAEAIANAEPQHRQAPTPVHGRWFRWDARAPRLLPIGLAVAVAAAAALAFAAPWSSSARATWTPERMETAMRDCSVKLVGVVTTSDHFWPALTAHCDERVTSARCRGLGARTRAGYAIFRCRLLYGRGPGAFGAYVGSYWTRQWTASTVCVSNVSRGTCPPALPPDALSGDPRKCMRGWYVRCIAETARVAATKRQGLRYKRCVASAVWTNYICTQPAGRATVTFIRHPRSWTTRVTSR